jgi:hypothetical protein
MYASKTTAIKKRQMPKNSCMTNYIKRELEETRSSGTAAGKAK